MRPIWPTRTSSGAAPTGPRRQGDVVACRRAADAAPSRACAGPKTVPHGRSRQHLRSPSGLPPPPPHLDLASPFRHSSCEYSLAIKCPRKPWGAGAGRSRRRRGLRQRFLDEPAARRSRAAGARASRPGGCCAASAWLYHRAPQQAIGEDDGRPVEVGCQEQASNHPKRLASRVLVVSVGDTSSRTRQVWIRKTNASEPLLTRREPVPDIETDGGWYRRDESGGWPEGCPDGVRRAGGVSLIQASLTELREPVVSMRREPFKWRPHKNLSTDARHWDGVARRSDEVAVMAMERRGDVGRSCSYPTGLSRRRCG